jgi:methylmalonyl-CoA/ethylmalonyl-CoA epimerase
MTFRAGRLLEVGIAVDKLDEASKDISYLLNTPLSPPIVEDENFSIRFRMARIDRADLEIMESTHPDGLIRRFIDRRGEGLHHICFEVADAEAALNELKERGVPVLSDKVILTANLKAFFLHPACLGGILVEFVEGIHPWLEGVTHQIDPLRHGIAVHRITAIGLRVKSLAVTSTEFMNIMGTDLTTTRIASHLGQPANVLRVGDIDLVLIESSNSGIDHVRLEVPDLEDSISTLIDRGAKITERCLFNIDGKKSAFVEIQTLHGMRIELVEIQID